MANRFGNRPRMAKEWHGLGDNTFSSILATVTAVDGVLSLDFAYTVIRMIGEYVVGTGTTAPVVGDTVGMGFGIAVVSTDAATLGGTAVPEPTGDPGFPWLFWANHNLNFNAADVVPVENNSFIRRSFDIRTKRKVKRGESLVQIFNYISLTGDPTVLINFGVTRVLIAR